MDFNFINNNSSTLYIILNSHGFNENKYEFENYFKNLFSEKLFVNKKKPTFLYLRDAYQCWYYRGIRGFSKNYKETIEKLKEYIKQYNIKKLIITGSSAGGYASLYFGTCLNADYIICFSPQVDIITNRKLYYNKFKYFRNFTESKQKEFDLTPLINNHINKIFILWVNWQDFYNTSKEEIWTKGITLYQNLNDEKTYNTIKENKNIEHHFIKNCNHSGVAYMSIKQGLLDKILLKII